MATPPTEAPAEQAMPGADTDSTEIVRRTAAAPHALARVPLMNDDEIRRTWRLASALAASRLFKDAHQAEQAFGKILIGRDLGLTPTQALQTIDIVEGSIFMRGVLLASFVRRSPDYHYKVVEKTHVKCRLLFLGYPDDEEAPGFVRAAGRWWEVLGEEEFTIEDALRAQLVKRDKPKSGWMAYPQNMLFWRCISNAVKFHAPDLLGGVPVYTEADEIPVRAALAAGEGDGQPQGLDLGPEVEKVLARAAELGHAALADRGSVEMQLGNQPPGKVVAWVQAANRELDEIPVDAEIVADAPQGAVSENTAQGAEPLREAENAPQAPPQAAEAGESPPPQADPERIAAMKRRALQLADDADALDASGDSERAEDLRDEASGLMSEVEAMTDSAQETLL